MRAEKMEGTSPRPRIGWDSPIDVAGYERRPDLTDDERAALATIATRRPLREGESYRWIGALARLWRPLYDVLAWDGGDAHRQNVVVWIMLHDMHQRGRPHWAWTRADWMETIGETGVACTDRHGLSQAISVRQQLALLAYILCDIRDFSGPDPRHGVLHLTLARRVFGEDAVARAIATVAAVTEGWGYRRRGKGKLDPVLCVALLDNRSPHLADLSTERLAVLRAAARTPAHEHGLVLLSRALVELGLRAAALPRRSRHRPLWERVETDGIAPEWVDWCRRWHRFAVRLTEPTRERYVRMLLKTGRWLAAAHPEVTSPAQWTYELAADWAAMVDGLKIGMYCGEGNKPRYRARLGRPFTPVAKRAHYAAMRAFFADLLEEPFNIPRRFDPARAFREPAAVHQAIGPNPRAIDIRRWSMIVHAAMCLDETDLTAGGSGPMYPLALVRAVAIVWCYAALRSDEIRRLAVGCIRWQGEDVDVAETGETLPKDAVCFLTVPVNKTNTSFPKAVNPAVGRAIAAWERKRPAHPAHPDPKTGELAHFLFAYKGHMIGVQYLNKYLIPMLLRRAGLPREDERGAITSHRARSTIATALYNAPDGMTIWELMQWLGHKSPSATQHYARVNPTKVAVAYEKAERTSRLVEVLIDHKADNAGDVKVYYVLGDHGLCGNAEWYTCIYRMACIKCPFFIPQDQAAVIRSRDTVEAFLKKVQLTPEEVTAAEDDRDKLTETHERTHGAPPPHTLHQRATGSSTRGIPLTVLHGRTG